MPTILRIKVELEHIAPAIWRRIEVPSEASFWDLHVAIQDAMGWEDRHLHAFEFGDPGDRQLRLGLPDPDGWENITAGWRRKVRRLLAHPGDTCLYRYDYGDDWEHAVLLEGILLADPDQRYPRCIAGERRCPPEDCGGPPGYADLLAALADPDDPEHASTVAWTGGRFDPEEFDPARVVFDDPGRRRAMLEWG
ncbi:plasmid pRiA4b ORF-3 family protein [bacterium]|nr:plasmid pRiA4b ORF-3 family protein [bacterium]